MFLNIILEFINKLKKFIYSNFNNNYTDCDCDCDSDSDSDYDSNNDISLNKKKNIDNLINLQNRIINHYSNQIVNTDSYYDYNISTDKLIIYYKKINMDNLNLYTRTDEYSSVNLYIYEKYTGSDLYIVTNSDDPDKYDSRRIFKLYNKKLYTLNDGKYKIYSEYLYI